MPDTPYLLTDLEFNEISLVDNPANPGARVVMFKRKSDPDKGSSKAGQSAGDQVSNGKDKSMTDTEKKVAELEKTLADLKKSSEATATKLAKVEAAKDLAETLAKLSDVEKAHYGDLDTDDKAEFLAMTPAKRRKAIKSAEDDDEVAKIGGQEIRKSAVGDTAFEIMKAQQAQLDNQAADIKKANDATELSDLRKRADDEYLHVPGSTEERADMLKAMSGMDEPLRKSFEAVFTQSEKLAKSAFSTLGHNNGGVEKGSAETQLDTLSKAYAEKHGVSFAVAQSKVLETEDGRKLYTKSQEAKGG